MFELMAVECLLNTARQSYSHFSAIATLSVYVWLLLSYTLEHVVA